MGINVDYFMYILIFVIAKTTLITPDIILKSFLFYSNYEYKNKRSVKRPVVIFHVD